VKNLSCLFLVVFTEAASASCGSAFCTINTSWDVQGPQAASGSRFDLRYEAITQNQPRRGSRDIAFGEIPRHHDEVSTRNRNWLATYERALGAHWGMSVSLPLVRREHLHIHNHGGAKLPEAWDFQALGDARVLARYRFASFESRESASVGSAGLNFGVKLPTGSFKVRNADAALAERSLQPGTGTTDALLGAFASQALPLKDLSWFAQILVQLPLNARDGFRPGKRVQADGGLRYDLDERWSLLLQLNALVSGRDRGVQAEPADTGGTSIHMGPGASFAATQDTRVYGFVQLPVVQHVNGVQLVAHRALVLGVSSRF
jgi:hypothetical protein